MQDTPEDFIPATHLQSAERLIRRRHVSGEALHQLFQAKSRSRRGCPNKAGSRLPEEVTESNAV